MYVHIHTMYILMLYYTYLHTHMNTTTHMYVHMLSCKCVPRFQATVQPLGDGLKLHNIVDSISILILPCFQTLCNEVRRHQ